MAQTLLSVLVRPGTAEKVTSSISSDPAPLPAIVPASLRTIVDRALHKNLYERQQTAAEIQALLDEIAYLQGSRIMAVSVKTTPAFSAVRRGFSSIAMHRT